MIADKRVLILAFIASILMAALRRGQGHRPHLRQQREVEQHHRARTEDLQGGQGHQDLAPPARHALQPDRTKLYVACGDDDVIEIIDLAKLEVVGRLNTGASPETFAIDEVRRRIYVANEESSTLAAIDMDQNIIVQEVATAGEPEGVFLSDDGKRAYVTSEVGDLIHLIDTENGHVLQDVVVGTRPRRFAATPDGKELWVSAELSGEVYIIDRQKFAVSGKIEFLPPGMRKTDVTPVGLALTKDGKTAFVTLGHAAHVGIVDVPSRKVVGYVLVGKRAWGVALSRDERTLFVANGLGDDVTVIDVPTRKATISVQVGRVPWGVIIDD